MGGIEELRAVMEGPVIVPGDRGFDDARRVWNAEIDHRPSVIARCASAADVVAAIGFARERRLEVSVRGGAHNPAGTAVCDDGLMVDLSLLNAVTVDPADRRARAGGGALLADLDAATLAHGLAVPAGMISHTGVGGLTLGGGMGWLTRKFGLSIDNLVSAEVVTADGRVLRAATDETPTCSGRSAAAAATSASSLPSSSRCTSSTRWCSSGCSSGAWTRARRRCGWHARSPRRCRATSMPWSPR
jgi:FAD/FMN-containing dehydrogenase